MRLNHTGHQSTDMLFLVLILPQVSNLLLFYPVYNPLAPVCYAFHWKDLDNKFSSY